MTQETTPRHYITIPLEEYLAMVDDQTWLRALESAGVDNWEWFDEARSIYEESRVEQL